MSKRMLILIIVLYLVLVFLLGKDVFIKTVNHNHKLETLKVLRKYYDEDYYDKIVEKLIMCESSGNPLAINPVDGGVSSLGLLQWKIETFREYAEKYGVIGKNASWNYVATIIWDKKINKYLAIQILKNEPETAKKLWYNCWRKIHKK
jgi:hypothetical protein